MENFSNKIEDLATKANSRILQRTFVTGQFIDELVDTEERVNLILKEMEEGFRVDIHTLMSLKTSYESTLFSLKKEMQEKIGRAIRVNSNRDLGDLLFHNLCLPSLRRTPTGKPSVAIDVLQRLCDSYSNVHPFLESVIEFKNAQTLIKLVNPRLCRGTPRV